jgi:hypothetical protein
MASGETDQPDAESPIAGDEKGSMRRLFSTMVGTALLAALLVSPAAAATTTGTWYFHPAQTSTTSSVVTQGFTYQSAVRAPINADGSSNWPAKRGVIPVQFDLLAAPSTTTTTTKTYDPPVWESLRGGTGTVADPFVSTTVSYATFCLVTLCTSPGTLTFNDITNLSATYTFTTGDCHAGSLRWDVYVMHNGNVETVEAYYGNPNGPDQSCSAANSGSGQNLITTSLYANRFEMLGGWGVDPVPPLYTTYDRALASTNAGTDLVIGAQLTLDSGFAGDQIATVSNVTVNDNTWVPKTTETTTTTTVDGPGVKTCTLPAAELRWAKNDATPTGAVNEAESIQPKDTGQFYRQVDCKYIYNLEVSSLNGAGTYTVWVRIGGVNIQVPATFDLR